VVPIRAVIGYLAGIVVGTTSITLLYLGMRAVMDVGGACADGGPYVTAQPCPSGTPLAMVGGMFGLFAAAGLIVWFGSRISPAAVSIVALGWPALFIALGWNFLDYAFHPPIGEPTPVWGWLIPGVLFWIMGITPIVVAIAAWREARAGRPGNRMSQQVVNRLAPIRRSPATSEPAPWVAIPTDPAARRVEDVTFAASDAGSTRPAATAGEDAASGDDLAEDLALLARLHATGDLSDDEFARAKADRLDQAEAT
jgi:hypothetical protein